MMDGDGVVGWSSPIEAKESHSGKKGKEQKEILRRAKIDGEIRNGVTNGE